MPNNLFFKPTVMYKEYMILDMIEKNSRITQREMSQSIDIAVSMVNMYLDGYVKKGYVRRKKYSSKDVEYFITKKGIERRKLLNIWYLKSSHEVYLQAKDNIVTFLAQIIEKGFSKILLYGAGEVAEIMLNVVNENSNRPLEVIAVIDDDEQKIGKKVANTLVIRKEDVALYPHDGILISSYTHHAAIYNHLEAIQYPAEKILQFFD